MLQQMSEATLTLLLTMLAVGAVIRFMPATGRGRRGKKARSRAVWFGIALGLVSSLALTAVNVEAPKLINRQTVGLITLPIAIALALVFLALLEVGVPPQVIDVDVSAVGIQVKDLVDGVAQELNVVGDDHDAAGEGLDPVAQPHDRVVVEVVGRLVEEEHIRVGEEHAGEFDAAALTARERIEPLVEDAVLKAEGVRDLRSLGVGGPSTGVGELLVELDVAFHGPLLASALGRGHLVLGLANARDDRVDAAHGDDAVASLHLRVTNVGVLREVADGAVGADGAGVLGRSPAVGFSGEETHRRGLAGTVASDEADAHAFVDPEGYMVDEFAGTDSQREVLDVNHTPRVEGGPVVSESTQPMTHPVGPPCSNCGHNGWCI